MLRHSPAKRRGRPSPSTANGWVWPVSGRVPGPVGSLIPWTLSASAWARAEASGGAARPSAPDEVSRFRGSAHDAAGRWAGNRAVAPAPAPFPGVPVSGAGSRDGPGPGSGTGRHHGRGFAAAAGPVSRRGVPRCGGCRPRGACCRRRRPGNHARRTMRRGPCRCAEEQRGGTKFLPAPDRVGPGPRRAQCRAAPRGSQGAGQAGPTRRARPRFQAASRCPPGPIAVPPPR